MEPNKTLFTVIKPETEKYKIIIENTLIMLSNRIYIDESNKKQPLINVDEALNKIDERGDNTVVIRANNGDMYAIKVVFQKITSTGKNSIVSDFFKDYAAHKKIIITEDFNNKIFDYMIKHRTQIFRQADFLSNLIDYRDQPKFELLSPMEMELFKREYNVTDYTCKKMTKYDPIAKYYNLRKGDIIRIIRPSPTSGEAIDYRIIM